MLIEKVKKLMNSDVKRLVDERIKSFLSMRNASIEDLFKELCFCLLTANFNAERGIIIQREIDEGFLSLSRKELALKLRELGHRYPNTRAEFIVNARKMINELERIIRSDSSSREKREWLVKNIKGLGYKEASHFLRNIGFLDLAIIDFHILDILEREGLIEKPRTLTRRKYLEIEKVLFDLARRLGLSLGELDLYLWYLETGRVLK
ncbi:N-glycosylase/DNA lyase [Candidatus Woesearchaeota archaeon]|nr:N-glycosylase/DNA lyase [Candidatus Woesearchaeota archaeon]